MKYNLNSIFIVDDDPITVFGIRKALLNAVDCDQVSEFENGKMALEAIIKQIEQGLPIPELIFLDINMPVMDGWTFLEEFHKLHIDQRIRINIVTSSIDIADRNRWETFRKKTCHFLDYKNKPIFTIAPQDIAFLDKAS